MNRTKEVIRFEVIRNLKKPSFWIAAVLIPIAFAAYIGIAALLGYNTENTIGAGTDTTELKLAVVDETGYIENYTFVNKNKQDQTMQRFDNKEAGIEAVKNKSVDVLYYVPKNIEETKNVEIYTKPEVSSLVDDYSQPIRAILIASASTKISALDFAIASNSIKFATTTFDVKDDHVIDDSERIKSIVGPGIALVCFYILMVVLGNRLTAAMVEEKENRISELILTNIKPSNLIVGKIISLMIVGIIQLVVLIVPILLLLKVGQNSNILPTWFQLSFDVGSIAVYLVLLLASYFLFTALSIVVGVISPTAKDANSYASFLIILVILPMFFINVFMPNGTSTLTYVLTYFPPSAPIALMLRGVFNNLPTWELVLGLIDIAVFGALTAKLATNIFCKNAIEFTPKINFKKLFSSPRKDWKK